MKPIYPIFKKVDIEDARYLNPFLETSGLDFCEYLFANLYMWREFDRAKYSFVNENLCILIKPVNEPEFFLEPMGNDVGPSTLQTCMKHSRRFSRVSSEFVSRFNTSEYEISKIYDYSDYIFNVQELANMEGRRFDGKRNHIKRFISKFGNYELVKLSANNMLDALSIFDRWSAGKDDEPSTNLLVPSFSSQRSALTNAFEKFGELKLFGCGIKVCGVLIGFAVGSSIRTGLACLHFLYADPIYPGLFQKLLQEAMKGPFSSYEMVNFEQDLGIPGLKKMKMSYHPIKLEEKYDIKSVTI